MFLSFPWNKISILEIGRKAAGENSAFQILQVIISADYSSSAWTDSFAVKNLMTFFFFQISSQRWRYHWFLGLGLISLLTFHATLQCAWVMFLQFTLWIVLSALLHSTAVVFPLSWIDFLLLWEVFNVQFCEACCTSVVMAFSVTRRLPLCCSVLSLNRWDLIEFSMEFHFGSLWPRRSYFVRVRRRRVLHSN